MGRPRELLAPSLLLLLAESPGHGYELMERLRPLGFDGGGPGPIYRELRSLEDSGLVTSDWFVGQSGPCVESMRSPLRAGSLWTARSPGSSASNASSPSTRSGSGR